MPMMWLRAHLEAMGELQAEEAFRGAEIVSMGAGKLDRAGCNKVVARWNAALGRGDGSHRMTGTSRDLAMLKALGMEVKIIG
jgi:hypothetical protein